jgi:hypothetical protein
VAPELPKPDIRAQLRELLAKGVKKTRTLVVRGSGATYIKPSDWVLTLVAGYHSNGGRPWGEGVDVRPAYEALLEALGNGSVHESPMAEPCAPE